MHRAGGSYDGVNRASLNAFREADTVTFVDIGHGAYRHRRRNVITQRLRDNVEQGGEFHHHRLATGQTFIDVIASGDRFGISLTSGVTSLGALTLRQYI